MELDLEAKELKDLEEIVKIQEIQDIPAQIDFLKRNDFSNLSFNEDQIIEGDEIDNTDGLKRKDTKDKLEFDSDSDEDDKKKHEDIINNLKEKLKFNQSNKISVVIHKDEPNSDDEMKNIYDIVKGGDGPGTPIFSKKSNFRKMTYSSEKLKYIEMTNLDENKDKNNQPLDNKCIIIIQINILDIRQTLQKTIFWKET